MFRLMPVLLCTLLLVLAIGCSDDDSSVNSHLYPPVVGSWLVDSASADGVVYPVGTDTVTYRVNHTGTNCSQIAWGHYEFTYSVVGDSLYVEVEDGSGAGNLLTYQFVRDEDQLLLARQDGAVLRKTFLTRQDN
ncbi:hypothetical protein KQH82_05335 [bacterium]|nr:hypothetical protein [bacterium]